MGDDVGFRRGCVGVIFYISCMGVCSFLVRGGLE